MRVATIVTALALATLGAAQRPTEGHEATIWDAYQNFRAEGDDYVFELRGTDTIGGSTVPVHALLYWHTSTDTRTGLKSKAQLELDVYVPTSTGERMSMRIVGDGTNLYRYDLDLKTVYTSTYGFYGDHAPDGYATNVKSDAPLAQNHLRSSTPSLSAYVARLVSEMNMANGIDFGPRYKSWSPGVAAQYFDEVPQDEANGPRRVNNPASPLDDTVTDPITGRTFTRGSDQYVFYGMNLTNPSRTVAFDLYEPDPTNRPGEWEVRQLNLGLKSGSRVVDLTITPQLATTFPTWAFQPYTGTAATAFRPANAGG